MTFIQWRPVRSSTPEMDLQLVPQAIHSSTPCSRLLSCHRFIPRWLSERQVQGLCMVRSILARMSIRRKSVRLVGEITWPTGQQEGTGLKLAFSTLGCPNWQLAQIADAARSLGYEGIELRAVSGDLNLVGRREFKEDLEATKQWFAAQQVSVCCVDSSCTFDSPDAVERRKQVDMA